ncbi:MAG: hypothetical protein ABIS67_04485 [Candidatus Eisenbacteria bacterium]
MRGLHFAAGVLGTPDALVYLASGPSPGHQGRAAVPIDTFPYQENDAMNHIRSRFRAAGIVATLVALTGCGMSPSSPVVGPDGGASSQSAEAATSGIAPMADLGVIVVNPMLAPPELSGPSTVEMSSLVNSKSGHVIELANVTLRIPKNAFPGAATVTVMIPDPAKPECHLSITPGNKNPFKLPVVLEFTAADAQDVRTMMIYWFDESQGLWVPIPTTVDAAGKRLSAEISHFSIYKASSEAIQKSGW